MKFKYFEASESEMANLVDGISTCSFCGKNNDLCFRVDESTTKEVRVGCVNCLNKGEFEFWHDTEAGLLDENGITKVYLHNNKSKAEIESSNLSELKRTPQILSIQQELWLVHCNDFMKYIGIWEPKDFKSKSVDGDGKKLFMEMTDSDMNHLWEDSIEEEGEEIKYWDAWYYVFECLHCNKLRGNWDCS